MSRQVSELQSLIQKQKEERAMVDAPIGSRERLYADLQQPLDRVVKKKSHEQSSA